MINVQKTILDGAYIIEPRSFGDNRGWFMESYSKRDMEAVGINIDFVQDNRSYSAKKGIIRGLHFQRNPMAQAKLITCIRGEILDVAVDLRKASPTYKQWISVELTAENRKELLIPKGFAHGFVTLSDDVEIMYKCDEFYSPEHDGGIRFDDPNIGVEWGVTDPILSEKDTNAPFLKDIELDF